MWNEIDKFLYFTKISWNFTIFLWNTEIYQFHFASDSTTLTSKLTTSKRTEATVTSSLKWSPLRAHGFFSTLQNFLKFFKNLRDFLLTCFFRKEKRSREEDSSKLKVEFDCCWLMVCTMLINWLNPTIIISYKLLFEVFLFSSLLLFLFVVCFFLKLFVADIYFFTDGMKEFWMSSLNWGWLVVVEDDFSVSLFSFSLRNKFLSKFLILFWKEKNILKILVRSSRFGLHFSRIWLLIFSKIPASRNL